MFDNNKNMQSIYAEIGSYSLQKEPLSNLHHYRYAFNGVVA
jgi:hypothetical protein